MRKIYNVMRKVKITKVLVLVGSGSIPSAPFLASGGKLIKGPLWGGQKDIIQDTSEYIITYLIDFIITLSSYKSYAYYEGSHYRYI